MLESRHLDLKVYSLRTWKSPDRQWVNSKAILPTHWQIWDDDLKLLYTKTMLYFTQSAITLQCCLHSHWIHLLRVSGFHGASLCLAVCWDEDFEENRWERLAVVSFQFIRIRLRSTCFGFVSGNGFFICELIFRNFLSFKGVLGQKFRSIYQAYSTNTEKLCDAMCFHLWILVLRKVLHGTVIVFFPWEFCTLVGTLLAWSWFQSFFAQDSLTNPPPWRAPYLKCLKPPSPRWIFVSLWHCWCQKHVQTGVQICTKWLVSFQGSHIPHQVKHCPLPSLHEFWESDVVCVF